MQRAIYLLSALAIGAATPAAAADLLYPGGSMLSEGAIGRPVWIIQAQCAGLFGATSNAMAEQGDAEGAATAKAQGVAFLRDSIDRLMRDRKLARDVATATVVPILNSGRTEGLETIRAGGLGARSEWNVQRSVCLDVNDVYQDIR